MSRVLRAKEVPASAGAFNLANFEQQARDIIGGAEARSAEIAAEAKADAEVVLEKARKDGFEAGHAEGLEKGTDEGRTAGREEGLAACRQDTSTLAQSLEALVSEFGARREGLIKDAERDLLDLAMRIAERVVRRQLSAGRGAVEKAVAEAISLAADRSNVQVHVNPVDLSAAEGAHAEIIKRFSEMKDLKMVGDESIECGGCLVTTEAGSVDLEVGTQLERIESLLIGERSGGDDAAEDAE